jgi:diguanylate cyclase (GGDEF)-like protein/PAS domain S-box-containing protein
MSGDLFALLDDAGRFQLASPAWKLTLGWTPASLIGRSVLELVHPEDLERTRALASLNGQPDAEVLAFHNRMYCEDGSYRWLEWNVRRADDRWYAIARDITTYKEQEFRAARDPLTNLPNRAAGIERIAGCLEQLAHEPSLVGLLFVDLDHLKLLNDGGGHELGDNFLRLAARQLRDLVPQAEVICRFGGDEFVLAVARLASAGELVALGRRLVELFERPLLIDGELHRCTVSVGAAVAADPGKRAESLIREADIAMYRAKARGGSRVELFDESVRREVTRRVDTERDLRRALELGQLAVHYQPIVALPDMTVWRCEALIRWQHPTRGVLQPQDFVPLAEETGLIVPIGTWVLDQACQQAASWRREGWDVGVTVNVSTRQLEQPLFVELVRSVLDATSLPPAALCLEITETGIMRDPAAMRPSLSALSSIGVRVAMDDFGSGQSSLSHLDVLPLDMIKIDRSFVAGIRHSAEDRAIVAALLSLARQMKIEVVAEGVENEALHAELLELGCELAQGFLYDEPRPAGELALDGYSSRMHPGIADPLVIREFMRQIGIPARMRGR